MGHPCRVFALVAHQVHIQVLGVNESQLREAPSPARSSPYCWGANYFEGSPGFKISTLTGGLAVFPTSSLFPPAPLQEALAR